MGRSCSSRKGALDPSRPLRVMTRMFKRPDVVGQLSDNRGQSFGLEPLGRGRTDDMMHLTDQGVNVDGNSLRTLQENQVGAFRGERSR